MGQLHSSSCYEGEEAKPLVSILRISLDPSIMSRAAKTFFACSLVIGIASIGGVHLIQRQEREVRRRVSLDSHQITDYSATPSKTMFAGVLRDSARLEAKKQQRLRQAEFDDQLAKRAYLESVQGISNPLGPPPPKVDNVPTSAEGLDFGCKSCEK